MTLLKRLAPMTKLLAGTTRTDARTFSGWPQWMEDTRLMLQRKGLIVVK